MTIITHALSGSLSEYPNRPRIGFRNLFRDGTVSVSSANSAYPKEQAYNGLTYDGWRATGGSPQEEWIQVLVSGSPTEAADYMAIAAHTLAGATLTPQRSSNGVSWTNLESAYVATNNRPIVWEWSLVTSPYWRLLIQNAPSTVQIGAIHIGRKTIMERGLPVGWEPPELNEEIEYTNTISEGGQTLGRHVIRRGSKTRVSGDHVDFVWARGEWLSFMQSAEQYAVFFWWAKDGLAEIMYGGVDKPTARFSTETYVGTSFELSGISR